MKPIRRTSPRLPFVVGAAVCILFGIAEESSANEKAETPGYIDAVVAASDNYKLLSQEGGLRVIEMNLPGGAQDSLHSHMQETVYFLSGGKARIHVGGQVMDAEIPDGHVMHHGPWTHSVQNVGDKPIRAIILERVNPEPVPSMEGYIDATVAAGNVYKLLSSEGTIRVVHMNLAPGMRDARHSHYRETVYFVTGGKVKIHVGDQIVDAEIPDGHVMHHGPWTHSVENVGDTAIEAIIFELVPEPPSE